MRKDPEICNLSALRQATRLVTKLYDAALAPTDLSANQYGILRRLHREGPSTLGDLADSLVMDRSTLGHLVRPLEKRGLVRLAVGEQDRRARFLTLTRSGESLVQRARPLWASAQKKFESAFGPDSASRLRSMLNDVVNSEFA